MADGDHQGSACSGGGDVSHESGERSSVRSKVREQDMLLPIVNISRIMKRVIPCTGKITKEAKETVQKCVSAFTTFINSEASGKCLREKRKVLNGDDAIWALSYLGFEDYIEPLNMYLSRVRVSFEGDIRTQNVMGTDASTQTVAMQPRPTSQPVHHSSFYQGMMSHATPLLAHPQGSFSQGMSHGMSQGVTTERSTKATDVSVNIEGIQPSSASQGDTKGATTDVSVKIERMQPSPTSQVDIKGSVKGTGVSVKINGLQPNSTHSVHIKVNYSQGMSYGISQVKKEGEGVPP